MLFNIVRSLVAVAAASLVVGCTNLRKQAVSNGHAGPLIVPSGDCDCASVGDTVYFDFESAKLRPDGRTTLVNQVNWLIKYPKVKIRIAGNCDDRGTEEYNLALGFRRANVDRDFLVAKGVASDRISVVSYGKEHPIATGDNEQAWAKNRNATTSIR